MHPGRDGIRLCNNNPPAEHAHHKKADELYHRNASRSDKASVESRMETFRNRWPNHATRASTTEIAEAGFFYVGKLMLHVIVIRQSMHEGIFEPLEVRVDSRTQVTLI